MNKPDLIVEELLDLKQTFKDESNYKGYQVKQVINARVNSMGVKSAPTTPAIDEILASLNCRTDIDGEKYDQRRHKGVPPKAKTALNKFYAEEMLRIVGEDLDEGDGWDWAFGKEARCCPGDDFAYFGNYLKKQLRTAITKRFGGDGE